MVDVESSTAWNALDVDSGMTMSNDTTSSVGTKFVFDHPTAFGSRVAILVTYLLHDT